MRKSLYRVIRDKCMDCCCDQWQEIKLCPCSECPLWEYRMGKNPETMRKRGMSVILDKVLCKQPNYEQLLEAAGESSLGGFWNNTCSPERTFPQKGK